MNWRRSLWNGGGAYLQQQDELGEALDGLHHEAVERDAVHTGGLLLLHSGGRGGGQVRLRRGGAPPSRARLAQRESPRAAEGLGAARGVGGAGRRGREVSTQGGQSKGRVLRAREGCSEPRRGARTPRTRTQQHRSYRVTVIVVSLQCSVNV